MHTTARSLTAMMRSLLIGLCVLFKLYVTEACAANQQSLLHLIATENSMPLLNGSSQLPSNALCQWNITAPVGKVVRVDINFVQLNGTCEDEQARIFDGPDNSSDVIKTFCGKLSSAEIYFSSGRSFFLEAKTGQSSQPRILVVDYQSVDLQDCSDNTTLDAPLSPTEQNFSSPYYPILTFRNKTCGWYIVAPNGHFIQIKVTTEKSKWREREKVFDVDGSDFAEIFLDWESFDVETKTVFSKFEQVYISWKSDPNVAADGIFVSYTAIRIPNSCSASNTEQENMNILFRNSSDILKSPGYPSPYPVGLVKNCLWRIVAPKGQVVRLEILSIRMGIVKYGMAKDVSCCLDGRDGRLLFRKCETEPSPLTLYSKSREFTLEIEAGSCSPGPGFIANYSFVPKDFSSGSCSPISNSPIFITGEGGSFSSLGYPYSGAATCGWNITVPQGKLVKLTFLDLRGDCRNNLIEVFDKPNFTSETLVGKICREKVVISRRNSLYVKYSGIVHDYDPRGFWASYEAVDHVRPPSYPCSGGASVLTSTAGEFASYDYPLNYPNDASCSWELRVPPTHVVQLTFASFELQPSPSCGEDYVEVRQGRHLLQTQSVGNFCGSTLPAPFLSSYPMVYVKFVTDSSERYPGFKATFRALPNPSLGPCKLQGVDNVIPLNGTTGTIFSPLYPQIYPPNMTCTWMITVPEGKLVKLKISSFYLENVCYGPTLNIRDGQTESSDLLKSFCGRKFESCLFSSGRHLWVRFHSPDWDYLRGTGFHAVFEAVNQRTTSLILKIVGAVLGGMSGLCAVLAFWYRRQRSNCCNRNSGPTEDNGFSNGGADDHIFKRLLCKLKTLY